MRAATTIRTGPAHRAKRRPPGRLDSRRKWTDRRGLVTTFNYGYDLIKRVTSQSRTGDTAAGGTSGPIDSTYSYAYDGAGRLCQLGDVTTGNATQIRDITTDADGNRLSYGNTADPTCLSTTAPNAAATQALAYNLDDSIKSGPTGGVTGCANVSYTYNSAGELTSDGLNNYTYDGFGNTSADNESNLTLACITGARLPMIAKGCCPEERGSRSATRQHPDGKSYADQGDREHGQGVLLAGVGKSCGIARGATRRHYDRPVLNVRQPGSMTDD